MPVEGLDHTRVRDRERRLLDVPEDRLVVAHDLHEDAAVVTMGHALLDDDPIDHGRPRAARSRRAPAGGSGVRTRVAGPSIRFAPLSATRFPARWSESIAPASVHQPSSTSHMSSPRPRYQLFTSVISSSPRAEGLSVRMTSNTCPSYM